MNKQNLIKKLPRSLLNICIFTSRSIRSPKFMFTRIGFFRYNYYNFKEFILGKNEFIVKYGNLKFYNFGREILNEKNDITYSKINHCKNVLDLGGYNGDTALFLSEYDNNKIFVFEPEYKKFSYITKNIELNKKEKEITPYNYAVVANNFKTMNITKESDYDVASSLYQEFSKKGKQEVVKCIHIKDVLKLANFDGMKCDIEGGEWEIIKWLIKTKKLKQIKKIIFELHFTKNNDMWDSQFKDLLVYFKDQKIKHNFSYCNGGKPIKDVNSEIKKIINKEYKKDSYSIMLFILND